MQVLVRDNNIDQALRVLKKKMQREGVFREMKRRRFYEKPSEQAGRRGDRKSGSDGDGRLDVEVAAHELLVVLLRHGRRSDTIDSRSA